MNTPEHSRASLRQQLADSLAKPGAEAHWRKVACDPVLAKRHAAVLRIILRHYPHVLAPKSRRVATRAASKRGLAHFLSRKCPRYESIAIGLGIDDGPR